MNSKVKGNGGERELRNILTAAGISATRNVQTFIGGAGNPDISCRVRGYQLHVEAKRTERLNLPAAMRQAERDASNTTALPVVCHRSNKQPWLITLHLDDFLRIAKDDTGKDVKE